MGTIFKEAEDFSEEVSSRTGGEEEDGEEEDGEDGGDGKDAFSRVDRYAVPVRYGFEATRFEDAFMGHDWSPVKGLLLDAQWEEHVWRTIDNKGATSWRR